MDDSLSALNPPAALLAQLQAWRQEHLVAHWAALTPAERQQLVTQINAIDFTSLQQQFAKKPLSGEGDALSLRAARAKSPDAIVMNATDNRFTAADARARGEEALRAGKVGMILVAGGQGTRLGFEHPKGMFPIGPLSQRSLFEILIDRLRAVSTRYGTRIPLFIMTSPATTAETRAFLTQHQNFGLADDDLFYFEQGTLPAVDAVSGQVL
ncbi:MAG TPA: UTP--glucose-1-phosphate uridylyltransferase, partial [Pirellulaceae bacterium]|nr:UTP--glucose-1-phosphate uridylyltransferase [Pirellulaceae bacterium]